MALGMGLAAGGIATAGTGAAWLVGGNTNGAAGSIGTNDAFDVTLERADVQHAAVVSTGLRIASGDLLSWSSTTDPTAATDLSLRRNAANSLRILDATAARGVDIVLSAAANVSLRTSAPATSQSLLLQDQTLTPAATHNAVDIDPTYAAENFTHRALNIDAVQAGANTTSLSGLRIALTKSTAATTLGTMNAIFVDRPAVTGTVTDSFALDIADQNIAGITNPRAIRTQTGLANALVLGNSMRLFANSPDTLLFGESTGAKAILYTMSTGQIQTISTSPQALDTLRINGGTFTAPGATHDAVRIDPTWPAENFSHRALQLNPTQNGANTTSLFGIFLGMGKATAATTLDTMSAIRVDAPTVVGTVTTSVAVDIADQTNVGITNPRALRTATTGVANAFSWGGSALQYANAANNVRLANSTNARGIDFNLTAAGTQTITTSGGNLSLSATTGIVANTAARHEWAAGANVASAGDLTLGADGNVFQITGTTTINAITTANWQAGSIVVLYFAASLTVNHNTAGGAGTALILLAGAAAFTATADDTLTLMYNGTNWRELARTAI